MNRNVAYLTAIAASISLAGVAEAKKPPELSGLALQQIQSRDYEVSKAVTFPSVMTILQDSGYRIQAADKDTGLITGTASTKSHMNWVPFVGFGRSKKTPVISAYIEDRGSGSRVRLNFIMAKTKNQGYGMSWSDEEPITDPATYRDAFERIDKEVFVRQALNAPTPKPAPAAATPVATTSAAPNATGLMPNPPDTPPALKLDPK